MKRISCNFVSSPFGLSRVVSGSTINEHVKNIYEEGELQEEATIRKNRIVQKII